MTKSLLIVESPAKARTIKKYLGPDFTVKASVGHVKDLPKRRLGIDTTRDFAPEYVTIQGKKQVLQELRPSQESDAGFWRPTRRRVRRLPGNCQRLRHPAGAGLTASC